MSIEPKHFLESNTWNVRMNLHLETNEPMLIIYYIADLPVTPLRVLTNKSDNIAVPYASLRSLILLLSSLSFAFPDSLLRSSWDARLRLA